MYRSTVLARAGSVIIILADFRCIRSLSFAWCIWELNGCDGARNNSLISKASNHIFFVVSSKCFCNNDGLPESVLHGVGRVFVLGKAWHYYSMHISSK